MRTFVTFFASASLLLVTAVAAADEPAPQETVIPPAPPAAAAPAAPLPPARTVVVIRDDGWKPGGNEAWRMRSRGLLIGGLVTAGVGLAGIIGGAVMIATDTSTKMSLNGVCSPQGVAVTGASSCLAGGIANGLVGIQRDLGQGFAVTGGIAVVGGVAMAIAGASQVPITRPTREQQARGIPAVAVGPGQASLRWSF
jgi:hypothetical protein